MLFTIVKSPGAVAVAETTKSISKNGASIGRGRDNSWVLPDPERYMSSLHTEIVFNDGKFFAIDHSTNGTFHNDPANEIGKDNQVELNDGDKLIIGDYEIIVSMVDESSSPVVQAGPFDVVVDSSSQSQADSVIPGQDVFNDSSLSVNSEPFSPGFSQKINNGQPLFASEEILDPLVALSSSESIEDVFTSSNNFHDQPVIPMGTQGDSDNMLSHSVQFPEMIPDNWFDMPLPSLDEKVELADVALTEMNYSSQELHRNRLRSELGIGANVGTIPPMPKRSESEARRKSPDGFDEQVIAKKSNTIESQSGSQTPQEIQSEAAEKIQQIKQHAAKKRQAAGIKNPVVSISANEDLIAAMGLNIQDMSDQQIQEINNVVGEFLQVAVKGLMLILKSRSTLKNEFRMSVTTIQSAENNPLKFSPTMEDAMVNMFVRSGNAYIDPVTAIKEAIESVADHQFAVFAGMRSAFNHLLERFNPEILEAKFNKHKSSLLATKKARNWELFASFYEDIIKDRDDSFQYLFGDEFVQAYEQQMQQLKLTRANQKK